MDDLALVLISIAVVYGAFFYAPLAVAAFRLMTLAAWERRWRAFIPVWNLLVYFDMSGFSRWLALLLLVPILNIAVMPLVTADIAERVRRPRWLGLLAGFSIISLIGIPLLALTSAEFRTGLEAPDISSSPRPEQRVQRRGSVAPGIVAVFALVVAAGVAVALVFFLRDGGGGGNAEVEAYFNEVSPVMNDLNDRTDDLEVPTAGDTFLRYAVIFGDTTSKLREITPPEEVADAHGDLIKSMEDATVALTNLSDQYASLTSLDEVERILREDPAFLGTYQSAVTACSTLVGIGEDEGVDVHLELCSSAQPAAGGPPAQD